MKNLIYLALSVLTLHEVSAFGCEYDPVGVSNFNSDTFAGYWTLNKSTLERQDRVGCVFWQLSEANMDGEIFSAISKVKLFSWNKYEKGKTFTNQAKLVASTDGKLTENRFFEWGTKETARIIDTDYSDYAVVYRCKIDESVESLLDGVQDQIQIYTRSGTLSDATNTSIMTSLTTAMPSFDQTRLETITTTQCSPRSYYSQFQQFFEDPAFFFR